MRGIRITVWLCDEYDGLSRKVLHEALNSCLGGSTGAYVKSLINKAYYDHWYARVIRVPNPKYRPLGNESISIRFNGDELKTLKTLAYRWKCSPRDAVRIVLRSQYWYVLNHYSSLSRFTVSEHYMPYSDAIALEKAGVKMMRTSLGDRCKLEANNKYGDGLHWKYCDKRRTVRIPLSDSDIFATDWVPRDPDVRYRLLDRR